MHTKEILFSPSDFGETYPNQKQFLLNSQHIIRSVIENLPNNVVQTGV